MRRYFFIDEDTGIIYLRSPLKGVQREQFNFKIRVVDQGYPENSDEADVRIKVNADRSKPLFIRSCGSASVDEVMMDE